MYRTGAVLLCASLVLLVAAAAVVGGQGCDRQNSQSGRQDGADAYFNSDGVRLRYVVNGVADGPPVVFINGFPEQLEVWSEVVASPQLKGYRLIRFDSRGLGLSDKPHDRKHYGRAMVDDVGRLLDHLSVKKAHVVGYSMGAWVAMKLVTTHPGRLVTATLGGSAGLHPSQHERNLIIADAIDGKDIRAAVRELTLTDGSRLSEEDAKQTEHALTDVARQYATQLNPNAVAAMMRGFGELMATDEELSGNTVPVLGLYSNENDPGRPLAGQMTTLQERMPNVSLVQIRDANHGNARSKPQFTQTLAIFLAKHTTK